MDLAYKHQTKDQPKKYKHISKHKQDPADAGFLMAKLNAIKRLQSIKKVAILKVAIRNNLRKGNSMNLKQHIQEHHGGNVTAYAKEYGTSRQQMEKWLKLDCRVIEGIIYRPVAKHKDRSQTTTALKV